LDSKHLFREIAQSLVFDADPSEKEAISFLIMENIFQLPRTDLMIGKEIEVDRSLLNKIISRLNNNEPAQYVLGNADFYGRTFTVNRSVLIPRPETEILITLVNEYAKTQDKNISIIDIGTGSGCIAITLALEIPSSTIAATDVSPDALNVARRNAAMLHARVGFHLHDIRDVFPMESIDIIVSNPPYILESEKKTMQKNVVEFEPLQALFVPDNDPLVFHRAIAENGTKHLTPGGFLITEINERLGKETAALFESSGYMNVKIEKDLDNKDRFVSAIQPQ
jgi:release factor glutamine methyltransferase